MATVWVVLFWGKDLGVRVRQNHRGRPGHWPGGERQRRRVCAGRRRQGRPGEAERHPV